jgi:hypothetical protein
MTANELRDWLHEEQSQSSGWKNESTGETIGHERFFTTIPLLNLSIHPHHNHHHQKERAYLR